MKKFLVPIIVSAALSISIIIGSRVARAQNTSVQSSDKTSAPDAAGVKATKSESSPIFVTEMPAGYRDWKLISVAHEEGTLTDIRAILGNDVAIKACREGGFPLPEGAIIARIAWRYDASEENNQAFAPFLKAGGIQKSFVAGPPTNGVQFMIKDSRTYASTGGWGYGHFNNGKPADRAFMQDCYACHKAIKDRDFVFTRYAP